MNLIPQVYGEQIKSETRDWGDIKKGFTHFADGDVVLAKITPCFQNGKAAVMRGLRNGVGAGTTELHIFRPLEDSISSEYVLLYLKSPNFLNDGISRMTGTAGQKRVPNNYFSENPFPLPPIKEQKRIVAKVDQLMALCDELEARQQKRREGCVRLNNTAIDQLLTTREPDDFSKHWQSICDNFELLYSAPENIGKLRQAILQLAVQGKLVPQDPNDEPASVLIEKIKAEKEWLVKEMKIERLKPLPPIKADEIPFKLPDSWKWVRLGEVSVFGPKNGYSPKPVDYITNVKSLTLSATTSGEFNGSHFKYIDEKIDIDSHLWLEEGDFLIQRGNTIAYVGVAAVYKGLSHKFIYPDLMMKIRFSKYVDVDYLHQAINNKGSRNFFRERATGTSGSMPKINQTTVISLPIPLPPQEEQKCIVAKVNQLMTLCDKLESKLIESQTDSNKLMDAAVRQVLTT